MSLILIILVCPLYENIGLSLGRKRSASQCLKTE